MQCTASTGSCWSKYTMMFPKHRSKPCKQNATKQIMSSIHHSVYQVSFVLFCFVWLWCSGWPWTLNLLASVSKQKREKKFDIHHVVYQHTYHLTTIHLLVCLFVLKHRLLYPKLPFLLWSWLSSLRLSSSGISGIHHHH